MRRDLIDLLVCPFTAGSLALEGLETNDDEVEFGILRGPVAQFPIISGIPVLRGGDDDVVASLRAGDLATAEALAVIRGVPLTRLDALGPALEALRPVRSLARWLNERQRRSAASRTRAALHRSATDPDALLSLTMLEQRRPNPEGFRYFRYRLGLPRHLVALGCLTAVRPGPEPVLEIGCGAGHLTWQIASLLSPRPVLAVDHALDLLWVARHQIAPGAGLICADARLLPIRDRSCSLAVAVDVLSFITEKATVVRELERVVTAGGGLVLTSLINAAGDHEYAGEPLTPPDWARLVSDPHHRLHDDDVLLDLYLAGEGPPESDAEADGIPRTVSVLAGDAALAGAGTAFSSWPHAGVRLGPHPVLAPQRSPNGDVILVREPPSASFERDNPGLRRYVPERLRVPASVVADARAGHPSVAIDELVASVALIGYPVADQHDPWR